MRLIDKITENDQMFSLLSRQSKRYKRDIKDSLLVNLPRDSTISLLTNAVNTIFNTEFEWYELFVDINLLNEKVLKKADKLIDNSKKWEQKENITEA